MATRIEELRQAASEAWDIYAHEMAQYNDDNLPTAEQAAHIDELRHAGVDAQKNLQRAEQFAQNRADFEAQDAMLRRGNGNRPPAQVQEVIRHGGASLSLGARLVALPEYEAWLRAVMPNGRVPERSALNSPPLGFKGLGELFNRRSDLITGGDVTSGGAFLIPDQYPNLVEFGRRPLTIRQIITNLTTSSDSIDFVRVTNEVSAAAIVPEATVTDADTSGGEPGIKPESSMTFERVNTPVKTIAHWLPATTRALSDAAQLRGLIDSFLRYGVELELEEQIVNGDGIGENFDGILATTNVQQQDYDPRDAGSDAALITARVAKRKVRTIGRRIPNAYVLNPEDWENFEVAKDGNERFYGQGPFGSMTPVLWGLPVVESEAMPVGTGLVGNFLDAVLWDREQASISVSNSHADFFIRNLVAILCELRAAFGVLRPQAFVAIDLTGPS